MLMLLPDNALAQKSAKDSLRKKDNLSLVDRGFDFIIGGAGNDSMHGGGGRDTFTFGANWGNDTVEQLGDGESQVPLWFATGDHANWDASTMTYTDGNNSVTVTGVTADLVELYIGNEFPWDFEMMSNLGIFTDATSEKVFEDKNKGLLA